MKKPIYRSSRIETRHQARAAEEPHYENDEEWERREEAWRTPDRDSLQAFILDAVELVHYPSRQLYNTTEKIVNNPDHYPVEWVQKMCAWARDKRTRYARGDKKGGAYIKLPQLLSAITNEDRLSQWKGEHGSQKPLEERY